MADRTDSSGESNHTTANRAKALDALSASTLKLQVHGLSQVERRLLEATVKLSERRTPRLQLLPGASAAGADVLMVDTKDPQAMAWARRQVGLDQCVVIWIDGSHASERHMVVPRPVQWSILPMLLARALEQASARGGKAVPEAAQSSQSSADINTAERMVPGQMHPVLIVDDSLAMRAHVRAQLEARGYSVVEAQSANDALKMALDKPFACVLMDVMMPGTDGYECCRQIKSRLRGAATLPVVMLTSKSSPFDRIRGKMAGCDAYLTKPVEAHRLYEVLAQLARTPMQEGANLA